MAAQPSGVSTTPPIVTSGRYHPFIEDFNYILLTKKLSFASLIPFKGQGDNILKKNNVFIFIPSNKQNDLFLKLEVIYFKLRISYCEVFIM